MQQQMQQRPGTGAPPSQGQAPVPVRVHPMTILRNHEIRLRKIEGADPSTADTTTVEDERVVRLIEENVSLKRAAEELTAQLNALKAKVEELSKLQDNVSELRVSVLRNSDMVESLTTEVRSAATNSSADGGIAAVSVSSALEDVTVSMNNATIAYGEVESSENTVTATFDVQETVVGNGSSN